MCQSHDHHDNICCFVRLNKFNVPFFSLRIISSQFVFNKNCIKYNRKIPGFFNINISRYEGQNFLVSFFFFISLIFFSLLFIARKMKSIRVMTDLLSSHFSHYYRLNARKYSNNSLFLIHFNMMIHNFVVNKSPSIKRNLLVNLRVLCLRLYFAIQIKCTVVLCM